MKITRALPLIVLMLSRIALAADVNSSAKPLDTPLADPPRATRLSNGSVLVNESGWSKLDAEVRRLQALEETHKAESWVTVFLVGLAVGAVAGAAVAVPVTLALRKN